MDVVIGIGIKWQPVRMKNHQARFSGEEALRIHMGVFSSPATGLFKRPRYT